MAMTKGSEFGEVDNIVIFAASFVVFKEAYTVTKLVGIALIIASLVFLNLKG